MQQLSLDAVRMFVTVHDFGGYAKAGEVIGRFGTDQGSW